MTARALPEGLDWDALAHLEAVERLGTAAAAGRELGVAASTVYRRIAALEASLGLRCFVPGEGVTAVARELASLVRETAAGVVAIRRRAREDHGVVRGRVRLTTVDGFMPLLVEPLTALAARHPELELDVNVSNAGLSVRRGEADVALTAVPRPGPHLVGRRLFSIEFGVFGLERLARDPDAAPWVVLGPPLHTSAIARWEQAHLAGRRIAVRTASRRAFDDLVGAGVGIGVMPRRLAALDRRLVEVPAFREATAELTTPAWLLTHPELQGRAPVVAVMRTIADYLAG